MKWTNKGNQFDSFAKEWNDENDYYIWGAAVNGINFYNKIKNEINIKGFIDSDTEKHGKKIDGCNIYSFYSIKINKEKNFKTIIASSSYEEISLILSKEGLIENKDFCSYKMFLAIFYMYKYKILYMNRMDLSITNKCTLKCEKCNMLMPLFKNPRNKDLGVIKGDLDVYFKWVDNLGILNILGGEPFIYPYIVEVINYIGEKYRERVDKLNFFSNGTCKLSEEVLKACKRYNFEIQISDYSNKLSYLKDKIDDFVKALELHGIKYQRLSSQEWMDFGSLKTDNSDLDDEKMIRFFDSCNPPFRGLSDKKIYFCHINTSAVQAKLFDDNENDYFDLSNYEENKKIELMEFDLGFNDLGYITFCRKCNGCSIDNKFYVEVAKQVNKNN